MTMRVNKAPTYDHHNVASEDASSIKTSRGVVDAKRYEAATTPRIEIAYQIITIWSTLLPRFASRNVGRPMTEPLA